MAEGGVGPGFVDQIIAGTQRKPSAGSLLERFLKEPSDLTAHRNLARTLGA